jgi:hypothetical protein
MDPENKAWYQIMPVLPLAPAVPVVRLGVGIEYRFRYVALGPGRQPDVWLVICSVLSLTQPVLVHQAGLRVNLEDPQGFGYALRLLLLTEARRDGDCVGFKMAQDYAILRGEVTDADKLRLAKALADTYAEVP